MRERWKLVRHDPIAEHLPRRFIDPVLFEHKNILKRDLARDLVITQVRDIRNAAHAVNGKF